MSPRMWGDGVGRKPRAHTVTDISFTERPCYIVCSCGEQMQAWSAQDLEDEWDTHRNAPLRDGAYLAAVFAAPPRATDTDVSEFLAAVGGSRYTPTFDPETGEIS